MAAKPLYDRVYLAVLRELQTITGLANSEVCALARAAANAAVQEHEFRAAERRAVMRLNEAGLRRHV